MKIINYRLPALTIFEFKEVFAEVLDPNDDVLEEFKSYIEQNVEHHHYQGLTKEQWLHRQEWDVAHPEMSDEERECVYGMWKRSDEANWLFGDLPF